MKFNMIRLVIITVVFALISLYIFDNTIVGALIGFGATMLFYVIPLTVYYMTKLKKWLDILYVECDPVTYIEMGNDFVNNKQYNQVLIKINLSAGRIELGDFQQAKTLLLSIDLNQSDFKNSAFKFAYYGNLLMCHLHLNQIEDATKVFNNDLEPIKFKNQRQHESKKLIESFYLFYKGQYQESKNYLESKKNNVQNVNEYVNIQYYLAQIELKQGQVDLAKKKLIEVVEKGNKLYIAQQAKQQLENLI